MDLDDLIKRLMNLTYRDKGDTYDFPIIYDSNKDKVFAEILSWYKDQNISNEITECKIKIAELEAKVYAYENIIANSNFAPIIREISEEK